MSSLSATQSDGYYLPPEYFESGAYKKVSRNRFAAETANNNKKNNTSAPGSKKGQPIKVGHNQWLKHGVVRFELPEKVVCFGCKQSIGRGTRFNARKTKTDQSYFTTPIFEFNLSCRNCKEPWVIRTDPKERGFEYVSGVKRQAGQDRYLITEGVGSVAIAGSGNAQRTSLDTLEAAVVTKKTSKRPRTEIEELEGLLKLNQSVNAEGKDVDHNASIRKAFRYDRREKRKRLIGGKKLGWKGGMALLEVNDSDILLSKETSYGRASVEERSKLSKVRKSSIFESSRKAKGKRKKHSSRSSSTPEIVGSEVVPESIPSNNKEISEAVPETILSSLLPAAAARSGSSIARKKKLALSNGVLSIMGGKSKGESRSTSSPPIDSIVSVTKNTPDTKSNSNKNRPIQKTIYHDKSSLSFLDLVGAYGSSDDEQG